MITSFLNFLQLKKKALKALLLLSIITLFPLQAQNILNKQDMLNRFTFWHNQDWEWYKENIPFLETPDNEIDKTYYYRWELVTTHLIYGSPADGYASTEFIDRPWWSGSYGTISCPAGHQLYDYRWFRNPKYFRDYATYWYKSPGAQLHNYTNWAADAVWQSYKVSMDYDLTAGLLNDLKHDYYQWEDEHWVEAEKLFSWDGMHDGMETNINSRQTPNWFAGAPGYRPTLNSYMWAHAKAVENIATIVGDNNVANEFSQKADVIRTNFLKKCWDPSRDFFFQRFENNEVTVDGTDTILANTLTYQSGKYKDSPYGQELMGYVPWYFDMPTKGYESAWKYLMDPDYFYAPYGPTTVGQKDPLFLVSKNCCVWSGNSWPFATSQTIKALANLLNNYEQSYVNKDDFFELLKIFAVTHRKNGEPYIAEALNPYTGSWDGHDHIGHSEHYYHSSYIDLIINDLIGLKPQSSDSILIEPLIPEDWDYFCLDDVMYHGHQISIVWDKDGTKYKSGQGLKIYSDGVCIASSPSLKSLSAKLSYQPVVSEEKLVNYAVNNSADYFPKAIASFPGIDHPYTKLNDGQYWYLSSTTNLWSNIYSDIDEIWCGIDFGGTKPVQKINIYFADNIEGTKIATPLSYSLQYWNGSDWETIPHQLRSQAIPKARMANTITFPEINTDKIRFIIIAQKGQDVGVSEIEAWGIPILPVRKSGNIETSNGSIAKDATFTVSYVSPFDNVAALNDGSINPAGRWTAFESKNPTDWVQASFNGKKQINTAYVYFFSDGAGVQAPTDFKIQYKAGKKWRDVVLKSAIPESPRGNSLNIYSFNGIETESIRFVMTHKSEKSFSGIYEIELYNRK